MRKAGGGNSACVEGGELCGGGGIYTRGGGKLCTRGGHNKTPRDENPRQIKMVRFSFPELLVVARCFDQEFLFTTDILKIIAEFPRCSSSSMLLKRYWEQEECAKCRILCHHHEKRCKQTNNRHATFLRLGNIEVIVPWPRKRLSCWSV